MTTKIAIIGSGPTGIYTLRGLIDSKIPLSITIFESEADPGKGTPYHPDMNDQSMLANIASIEFPPIRETLVNWLRRQPDEELTRLKVNRETINVREFYPRLVLGEYLESQLRGLLQQGRERGHVIDVKARHRVIDIELAESEIALTVRLLDGEELRSAFDHVVMATGHDWPENTEIKPGYFISPWPASALKAIPSGSIGILGTSLSAIDAVVTVATAHGMFMLDAGGRLEYAPAPGTDAFHATMMSRKGLLPEADFYCLLPYAPLQYCTPEAIDALLASKRHDLLDDIFALFKAELAASDPDYAAKIGLSLLTVETIAPAYFAAREDQDPFVWAALNLAEAEQNKIDRYTVPWRYAILRMHEVIARAIPHLDDVDLGRFHKHFKSIFVDDYATVPHESIKRLLALHRAGKLDVLALGNDYTISTDAVEQGAVVSSGQTVTYDAFIDATGQQSMSARDIPFPTLLAQGVIRKAATPEADAIIDDAGESMVRTGGVDLDDAFRPIFEANLSNRLYCVAISFLLYKLPFVQGITSAYELGGLVSSAILSDIRLETSVAA
ncbi:putative NAD(P)/FAD-binding protein YdhS [Rhodoligotrophos appendicifer]|uniref:FAD/NAD(P)-binding protein n=1 Tax=Rhodoligotrophos appendicifer TaxID=987056 RepID=UPI0011854477|nr:FAD/NAD(P)-binding protein [Rhodoligotrophos appendicifer]